MVRAPSDRPVHEVVEAVDDAVRDEGVDDRAGRALGRLAGAPDRAAAEIARFFSGRS